MADEKSGCFLLLEKACMAAVGCFCTFYLIAPTFGIFEIIPDFWPVIGNLDEATAVVVLLNCLRYFGVDLTRYFKSKQLPSDTSDKKDT